MNKIKKYIIKQLDNLFQRQIERRDARYKKLLKFMPGVTNCELQINAWKLERFNKLERY